MHQTKTKILNLTLLLVYILTSVMYVGEIVLCSGADGHIEIEFSFNGSCNGFLDIFSKTNPKLLPKNSTKDDNDHCGPCKDIVIQDESDFKGTITRNNSIEKLIVFSGNTNPIIFISSFPLKNPFPPPPSTIPSTILSLQTITLLI